MLVRAVAHVRNEDMRRILKKSECEPGDVFDLPQGLAEVYLKEGWVCRVTSPSSSTGATAAAPEFAASSGAPERAVSQRGRGGLTRKSVTPQPDNKAEGEGGDD